MSKAKMREYSCEISIGTHSEIFPTETFEIIPIVADNTQYKKTPNIISIKLYYIRYIMLVNYHYYCDC